MVRVGVRIRTGIGFGAASGQASDRDLSAASCEPRTSSCSIRKAAVSTAVNTGSYASGGRERPGSSAVSAIASAVWCRGTGPGHAYHMYTFVTTSERADK